MTGTVPDHVKTQLTSLARPLTFECGDLPADVAVFAAGHEPNGCFREGVVHYLTGGLLSQAGLIPGPTCPAPKATALFWAGYAKNWRGTSTTSRGSPGSSGRQKPRVSSPTTEDSPPRSISGRRECSLLARPRSSGGPGRSGWKADDGSMGRQWVLAPGHYLRVSNSALASL
jgi:hypothetical protein